jgi:hypothetical protein
MGVRIVPVALMLSTSFDYLEYLEKHIFTILPFSIVIVCTEIPVEDLKYLLARECIVCINCLLLSSRNSYKVTMPMSI